MRITCIGRCSIFGISIGSDDHGKAGPKLVRINRGFGAEFLEPDLKDAQEANGSGDRFRHDGRGCRLQLISGPGYSSAALLLSGLPDWRARSGSGISI